MSDRRASRRLLPSLAAGVIIGVVEAVLAVAFAAFVFGGLLAGRLPDAIGLYLVAGALTLGVLAWRAGRRGVVGSVQDAAVAVLSVVAAATAAKAAAISQVIQATALERVERPDVFLTVIGATLVVTVLCGVVFFALGTFRLGNLVRFVPYPVVGGFLAGTGWLLFKGGIYVASGVQPALRTIGDLSREYELVRWAPAFAFGVLMLVAIRVLRRPMVIPAALGIGVVIFVLGMVLTGSSIADARAGRWLLGPFETARLWEPWTVRALSGADWSAVLGQWAGIATAVFVASIAILFNVSGTEVVLDRDLDTNEELRDAGLLNVVSGALGGIPGYHALSLTSLAHRMSVDARIAGLVAALVPLAAVVFGATFIELIPRMLVGGVLVLVGAAFIVEWIWDKRRSLPIMDYLVVWVILAGIVAWGFLPGVVLGLVIAFFLFVLSYGRVELVGEAVFGEAYRSNVDRPPAERAALRIMADRVQILRVHGFVFFGTANNLLERIRTRLESGPLRFLLVDLGRVRGLDASAVLAFAKAVSLAQARSFELVFTGASAPVRGQLARGGVAELSEVVAFEPDLDRGLQRAEDVLLAETDPDRVSEIGPDGALGAMPPSLRHHLERRSLAEGEVLIHQDDPPTDMFVLESGRLRVELGTPEGRRMRLRTVLPGVVVGEVALYTGMARTADVVAETPSVVLGLSRQSVERIADEDPVLAAALHHWLAATLAERLGDTLRAVDAVLD
jgi:SulP family sulfate permease